MNNNISNARWFSSKPVQRLITQTRYYCHEDKFRFVGGCVRNTLMNLEINDIDIATSLKPEDVIDIFSPDYNVIETGIQHGTVTVVIDHVPFEITTLRRDISTDGRHAEVEFVTDWEIDASRRDFTINALYADFEGNVYDYNGGINDIQDGIVKFIGDPKKRIEEDYLRILRLYRFQAWYGKSDMHMQSRAWASLLRDGLNTISKERISSELIKLLAASNTTRMTSAIRDMHNAGVLETVIPSYIGLNHFYKVAELGGDPIQLLSTMLPKWAPRVEEIAREMRLSREQMIRLRNGAVKVGCVDTFEPSIRAAVYTMGAQAFEDQSIQLWDGSKADFDNIVAKAWEFEAVKPKLPINGEDLILRGIKPGLEIGKRLKEIENKWIDSDFKFDRETLLRMI